MKRGDWTQDNDDTLAALFAAGVKIKEIARALGRTSNAVTGRAARLRKLGVPGMERRCQRWSRKEDAEIRKAAAAGESVERVARRLGRSLTSTQSYVRDKRIVFKRNPNPSARRWSRQELELMAENIPAAELAERIGRTEMAVRVRRTHHGLHPNTGQPKESSK